MPCDASHMEPNQWELEISKIYTFIDELNTGNPPEPIHLQGFHPEVYCSKLTQDEIDKATAELCERLQEQEQVGHFSLELQIWWRDHQEADAKRLAKEEKNKGNSKIINPSPIQF